MINTTLASLDAEDRSHWTGAPLNNRLEHFTKIFVKHKEVNTLLTFIKDELAIRRVFGQATGVLVIAASGAGKTSFINHLKRTYPDEETPTCSTRRVVCFKVPAMPSPKSMATALLKVLGDPVYDRGTTAEKQERIQLLLPQVGTLVIAIDDFQDVPSKRQARGVEEIANWIRDLCELDFPGLVIALGTEDAAIVRDAHKQLLRRMQPYFELPIFSMDSVEERNRFRSLLTLLDRKLPLAQESNLSSLNIARSLIAATGGIFDYLMKLLLRALVIAVKRGEERIELQDLSEAFSAQHQVAAIGGNPFDKDWNGYALTEPGQIFYRHDVDTGVRRKKMSRVDKDRPT